MKLYHQPALDIIKLFTNDVLTLSPIDDGSGDDWDIDAACNRIN